jgi:Ca2+-binding RTX toxin-like protein
MATITGTSGDDISLYGTAQNDVIRGLAGSDHLYGDLGNDRLIGGAGLDYIDGGAGIDTAVFDGLSTNYVFEGYNPEAGYLYVRNIGNGTYDAVLFVEYLQFSDKTIAVSDIKGTTGSYLNETINGGPGDDTLRGSYGDDILNGNGGNDRLFGGADYFYYDNGNSGNDTMNGGAGDDYFDGSDGNDIYNGGPGLDTAVLILQNDVAANFSLTANPTIVTGLGTKTLISIDGADVDGSSLADRITGGAAHDFLYGDAGNDRLDGAGGDDFLDGGYGQNILYGGGGNDIMFGGYGNFDGTGGNDKLYGGSGNDWLAGGRGNDLLVGGAGADILNGGRGSDTLTGSDGADIFIFTAGALGTTRTGEHDVVTDFVNGTDTLDLSALYDTPNVAGGPHAIGAITAGSAADGEAVTDYGLVYNQTGTKTFVYGDTDGVAGANFVIELAGTIDVSAAKLITTRAQWTTTTGIPYDSASVDDGMLHEDGGAPYYWFYSIGSDP